MAIQNDFTVAIRNYTRISSPVSEGRFLDVATSINTPHILTVRPKVVRDGICTFVINVSTSKESPEIGSRDDVLSTQLSFRFDPRRFSYAEAREHLTQLTEFYYLAGMEQKIFTGQV